jgi:hypothetical protein
MNYYFISYMSRRPNRDWQFENIVIVGHPFSWLGRQQRDFGEWEWIINSYQEITYTEFTAFKELVNQ